ncbi:hypothetical protein CT19425_U380029 [Cupriavidus taiwanensis]|uniref:Uncharacterized protein n=1 Tax=Cupriavidus taiwanensis TaxID=164546 RepID=A0A375IAB7_9BURK|nr:hypothetical protein CT19425_U380029 [Cupriavidus taiwanensis]
MQKIRGSPPPVTLSIRQGAKLCAPLPSSTVAKATNATIRVPHFATNRCTTRLNVAIIISPCSQGRIFRLNAVRGRARQFQAVHQNSQRSQFGLGMQGEISQLNQPFHTDEHAGTHV